MRLRDSRSKREIEETDPKRIAYYRGDGWEPVQPAKSAPKADWVEYAEQHGEPDAESETKTDLIAEYGDQ